VKKKKQKAKSKKTAPRKAAPAPKPSLSKPLGVSHAAKILSYLKILLGSPQCHLLIIESLPGWAKTSIIEWALREAGNDFVSLGSYSTPLHFYNCLCRHTGQTLVLDDSRGLLETPTGQSLLKAATAKSVGAGGMRLVSWGSTGGKPLEPNVSFTGKLILLTNSVPSGPDIEALLDRSIFYKIPCETADLIDMLTIAAAEKSKFPDEAVASSVLEYLTDVLDENGSSRISLRTLELAYEFAISSPMDWRELFAATLYASPPPKEIVKRLEAGGGSVAEQERAFVNQTGRSRRSFYYYRKELGLSEGANCIDTKEAADDCQGDAGVFGHTSVQ